MSLAHRVIPVLLTSNGMLVKGKQFNSARIVGNVQQAAEIHQAREVDELIVVDVGATLGRVRPDFDMIKRLTEKCFMPITVGGGVRTVEDVRDLLASGADKVAIGTAAIECDGLIKECADKFGRQAIVACVDALYHDGNWWATTRCGKDVHFYSAAAYARDMELQGAGELLVTSILNDGMMNGYDLGLIRKVAREVGVPVVASGGCGSYEHMRRALAAGADAVAAGAFFQWTDCTPKGACEYLAKKGYEVRK